MARHIRVEYASAIYHVTCRMLGDARSRLYIDEADYERYLRCFSERVKQYNIRLYMCVCIKNLLFTVIFLAGISAFCSDTKQQLDPREYLARELAAGMKNIVVPPGTYRLKPYGQIYLKLENLKDVTISFDKVKFIGLVNTRMLNIENCDNLTIKGLTIDYDPLPFTQAEIVSVNAKKDWVVELIDGYPEKSIMIAANGDKRVQVYSPKTKELVNPLRCTSECTVTKIGPRRYKISGGSYSRNGDIGDIAVFNCQNSPNDYLCHDVVAINCHNLKLENVTIYSGHDMGFVEHACKKTTYLKCAVDRCPPGNDYMKRGFMRLRSVDMDMFHCKDDYVGPQLISCIARYAGDDCLNIGGMYSVVTASKDNELRVITYERILIKPGDTVQLMTINGNTLPDAKVLAVTPDGQITPAETAFLKKQKICGSCWDHFFKNAYKVKIDRNVKMPKGSVIISNNRMGNGFLIDGCTFGPVRSRAILVKASNGIIRNNNVAGTWGEAALKAAPEFWFLEGGCSSNLIIENNHFRGNKGYSIAVYGNSGTGARLPASAHRNIKILNNDICGSTKGIQVVGCTGLGITGNKLDLNSRSIANAINLTNVADITKKNNTIKTIQ